MMILERFEGDIAVLYDEERIKYEIPRGLLPEDVKCGDIIISIDGRYISDGGETETRRKETAKLQNSLWK